MPFNIVRTSTGWIMNEDGCVQVRNTEDESVSWVPHNVIQFDEANKPFVTDIENTKIELGYEIERGNNHESNDAIAERCQGANNQEDVSDAEFPSTVTNKTQWAHDETISLIGAIENRYEELHNPKKRKAFWSVTSEILGSQGIAHDPTACKVKWDNLIRTYKAVKDKKTKTGRGPIKFPFFDAIDAILGDKPNNSSPHTVDVAVLSAPNEAEKNIFDSQNSSNSKSQDKGEEKCSSKEKLTKDYLCSKKRYYDTKGETLKRYCNESLIKKDEKVQLLRKKLELEERKVKALENLSSK